MIRLQDGDVADGLLFDLDGTLVDSASGIADCLNEVLARYGKQVETEWVQDRVGMAAKILFEDLGWSSTEEITALVQEFRAKLMTNIDSVATPYRGVPELLQYLNSKQVPIGVVTNKPTALAQKVLTANGCIRFITYVAGGDLGPLKPDPFLVKLASSALKIHAPIMVGDTAADITAGKNGGAITIAVASNIRVLTLIEEARPHRVIGAISELQGMLI